MGLSRPLQNNPIQEESTRISIRITSDDMLGMRFAYSPILELVKSYDRLTAPKEKPIYRRWLDEVRPNLYGIEFPYLNALLTNPSYVPDFITPTPDHPVGTLEGDIQRILNSSTAVIRKNILRLIQFGGDSEIAQHFLAFPNEALYCLVEEMRLYWKLALEHHWSRMTAVVEGDVLYRARQMALEGSAALFAELYPRADVRVRAGELEISSSNAPIHANYDLAGQGFYIVPAIFSSSMAFTVEPEWQPMLIYTPRGTGLWWETRSSEADQSLEIALGEGRARVLRLLAMPMNTGEIALRLRITAGAASQHLSKLNQAGLVEPHRSGKRVYYHLTQRGEHLLALFS